LLDCGRRTPEGRKGVLFIAQGNTKLSRYKNLDFFFAFPVLSGKFGKQFFKVPWIKKLSF
jgi:hypothetical protein